MKIQQLVLKRFILFPMLLLAISCTDSETPVSGNYKSITVDGDSAMSYVKQYMAFGPHPSGSKALENVRDWLVKTGTDMGYEMTVDSWEETVYNEKITFHNVHTTIEGKGDKYLILGSHYDSKRMSESHNFIGANDGGSSTALLLEIMRVIKKSTWDGPPIKVVFFDGEECIEKYGDNDGLHGSKRMANALTAQQVADCRAMILLDMIADKDLKITFSDDDDKTLIRHIMTIAESSGHEKHFDFYSGSILDDHVPFKKRGIPAVDIIDFQYGENNRHWHTDGDTIDKLSPESMKIIGDISIRFMQELSE